MFVQVLLPLTFTQMLVLVFAKVFTLVLVQVWAAGA